MYNLLIYLRRPAWLYTVESHLRISTSAVLRVDTSKTDATTGRKSVRIESKNQYDSGLFIFDILHIPYGCDTWPSVWLTDPSNWPTNGEIG